MEAELWIDNKVVGHLANLKPLEKRDKHRYKLRVSHYKLHQYEVEVMF